MTDMAENLFEKYGIKEVADVTLYRIERKDETYESQRKISVSSILKGALAREIVYPLDEDGKGEVEGYEAYVFKKADVLTHFNYDCDDVFDVKGSALFVDDGENPITSTKYTEGTVITDPDRAAIVSYLTTGENPSDPYHPHLFFDSNVAILSLSEASSGRNLIDKTGYLFSHGYGVDTVVVGEGSTGGVISAGQKGEDGIIGNLSITPVSTFRSEIVGPKEYDAITKADLETYVAGHGDLDWDGDTLTGGYITFIAPTNAKPEEIMARFQIVQQGLYESLGIVVRLTQPVKVSESTENKFSGTIVLDVTDNADHDYAITIVYDNATVDNATLAIINAAKGGSITETQATSLITEANSNPDADVETVETTVPASGAARDGIKKVNLVTVDEVTGPNQFLITFTAKFGAHAELETGIYDLGSGAEGGHYAMDADGELHGTHEFSYAE